MPKLPPTLRGICGEDKGYQKHRRAGEDPCNDCLAAHAKYMQNLRKGGPLVNVNAMLQRAQERAAWRLVREFPERFQALVADELAAGDTEEAAA